MDSKVQYKVEFTLQDGQRESFKKMIDQIIIQVKANEPDTLNYQFYFNEDETICQVIEHYTDSPAMLLHLANVMPALTEVLKISSITKLEFLVHCQKKHMLQRHLLEPYFTLPMMGLPGNKYQ